MLSEINCPAIVVFGVAGTSLHANKKVRVDEWVDALPDETVRPFGIWQGFVLCMVCRV